MKTVTDTITINDIRQAYQILLGTTERGKSRLLKKAVLVRTIGDVCIINPLIKYIVEIRMKNNKPYIYLKTTGRTYKFKPVDLLWLAFVGVDVEPITRYLKEKASKVFGIDFSKTMAVFTLFGGVIMEAEVSKCITKDKCYMATVTSDGIDYLVVERNVEVTVDGKNYVIKEITYPYGYREKIMEKVENLLSCLSPYDSIKVNSIKVNLYLIDITADTPIDKELRITSWYVSGSIYVSIDGASLLFRDLGRIEGVKLGDSSVTIELENPYPVLKQMFERIAYARKATTVEEIIELLRKGFYPFIAGELEDKLLYPLSREEQEEVKKILNTICRDNYRFTEPFCYNVSSKIREYLREIESEKKFFEEMKKQKDMIKEIIVGRFGVLTSKQKRRRVALKNTESE